MLSVANGRTLVRHLLKATLNGVVDVRDVIDQDNPWLEALFDALAEARASQPELLIENPAAAGRELGRQLDLPAVPVVIGGIVDAWSRGEIERLSLEDQEFKDLFGQLAAQATRRAA